MPMTILPEGTPVVLAGLEKRLDLNGMHGTVGKAREITCCSSDYSQLRVPFKPEEGKPLLVKPVNLDATTAEVPIHLAWFAAKCDDLVAARTHYDRAIARAENDATNVAWKRTSRDAAAFEGRHLRLGMAAMFVAQLERLRQEGAVHAPAVLAAGSRAELDDAVWDRSVEIQRLCAACVRACDEIYPKLLSDHIDADDPQGWSSAAAMYAQFLGAEPDEERVAEAKKLCAKVLTLHRCVAGAAGAAGCCRDALLAGAVATADGAPFAGPEAEAALEGAPERCEYIYGDAWKELTGRERLNRELVDRWHEEERERQAARQRERHRAKAPAIDP